MLTGDSHEIFNHQLFECHCWAQDEASFEDAFWADLRQIAKGCDETLSHSTTNVDRQHANLSASRLCVLGLLPRSRAH